MASIQGVYVALFGRPADPIGLAYFNGVTNNGADLSAIGDLASTAEYKARFDGLNNTQIVNSIYRALFNRDAEEGGLNFFVDKLNKGELNINNIAIAILDGAQGKDKEIVDFKIDAATRFTAALDTPTKVAAYSGDDAIAAANAFINSITEKQNDQDIKDAVAAIAAGLEVVLTSSADEANMDATGSLKTSVFDDTIDATDVDTWNDGDVIDAGVGTDTLNAVLENDVTVDGDTTVLKSVEVLNLTSEAAVGDVVTVDLDKAEGVTTVWAKESTGDLTVSNLAKTIALGVDGANTAVTFGVKDVAGTADALTINLKGAATTALTVDGIETLTLKAESASTTVEGIGGSTLKDAVVSGVGGGTYAFAASTTLKTVDVSAVTGAGANVDVSDVDSGVTVTGSKFAETITLGGAGVDVVVYNASNISTSTQLDTISGFVSGEDKIDLKAFGFASGATAAITTFSAAPIEGSSFLGNAVGFQGGTLFVDTNKDGVFNAATDLQVSITGVAIEDFIFA